MNAGRNTSRPGPVRRAGAVVARVTTRACVGLWWQLADAWAEAGMPEALDAITQAKAAQVAAETGETRPERLRHLEQRCRRRTVRELWACAAVLTVAVVGGLWLADGPPVGLVAALAIGAGMAAVGRRCDRAVLPLGALSAPAQVADHVMRTLTAHGMPVRLVGPAVDTPAGWDVLVILRGEDPTPVRVSTTGRQVVVDLPTGTVRLAVTPFHSGRDGHDSSGGRR